MSPPRASASKRIESDKVRLQKYLAGAGVGSRRHCEEYIQAGRVTVDGEVVRELGCTINPATQVVGLDGEKLRRERRQYFMLNKPKGYLCTNHDPSGRKRVIDLFQGENERLFPVGRLDENSQGLILVTNDGELGHHLAHPRYGIPKTYSVQVVGNPTHETFTQLRQGIYFSEGKFRVQGIRRVSTKGKSTILEIVLNEGQNREIRRLLAHVGHKVIHLERIAFGPLKLGRLGLGRYRALKPAELDALRHMCDNPPTAEARQDRGAASRKRSNSRGGGAAAPARRTAATGQSSTGQATTGHRPAKKSVSDNTAARGTASPDTTSTRKKTTGKRTAGQRSTSNMAAGNTVARKTIGSNTAGRKTVGSKTAASKRPTGKRPTDKHPTGKRPAGKGPAGKRAFNKGTGRQAATGKPASFTGNVGPAYVDAGSSDNAAADRQVTGKRPARKHPASRRQATGNEAASSQTANSQTTGSQAVGNETGYQPTGGQQSTRKRVVTASKKASGRKRSSTSAKTAGGGQKRGGTRSKTGDGGGRKRVATGAKTGGRHKRVATTSKAGGSQKRGGTKGKSKGRRRTN